MGEIIRNRESSKENVKSVEWVKDITKKELGTLKDEIKSPALNQILNGKDSFYVEKNGKIRYNVPAVKAFLKWTIDNPDKAAKLNTGVIKTLAIQIALEVNGYDVGKVDGIRGRSTIAQLRKFQADKKIKVD